MITETSETKVALMQQSIEFIKGEVTQINEKLDNKYVTKEEFAPVKKVVYGMVTIVLVAVFTAVVYLVVKQ